MKKINKRPTRKEDPVKNSLAKELKKYGIQVEKISDNRWVIGEYNVSVVHVHRSYRIFGQYQRTTHKKVYAYSRARSHEEIEPNPYGKGFFADTLKEVKESALELATKRERGRLIACGTVKKGQPSYMKGGVARWGDPELGKNGKWGILHKIKINKRGVM